MHITVPPSLNAQTADSKSYGVVALFYQLQKELKTTKNPVVLLLDRSEIQLLFSGMMPYESLREVLESYLAKSCQPL